MKKIAFLVFLLILRLTLTVGAFTGLVEASGTIHIRADGSVLPITANITSLDNVTYIFTDNNYGSVVVQRDNLVIDGAGYTLQGAQLWNSKGIDLTGRRNVTIRNMTIMEFFYGIWLQASSANSLFGNNVTLNKVGIWASNSSHSNIFGNTVESNMNYNLYLEYSSKNNVFENNVTAKVEVFLASLHYSYFGIYLYHSSINNIYRNRLRNNGCAVELFSSPENNLSRNSITGNTYGILLWASPDNTIHGNDVEGNNYGISLPNSSGNSIYHNNFVHNAVQVCSYNSTNAWDNGYPSGGNYWSDYRGRYPDARKIDEMGIWNTSYVLDGNNQDNYPLTDPWNPEREEASQAKEYTPPLWAQWWIWAIAAGILVVAITIRTLKKTEASTKAVMEDSPRQSTDVKVGWERL